MQPRLHVDVVRYASLVEERLLRAVEADVAILEWKVGQFLVMRLSTHERAR